jgi:hypothetical protein
MELTSLWITDIDILPYAWISSAGVLSIPGDLCFSNFAVAISASG